MSRCDSRVTSTHGNGVTNRTAGHRTVARAYGDPQNMPAAHTLTVRAAVGRTSGRERGLDCHDGIRTRRNALMGAGNVVKVCLHWPHLPDAAFRVLTQMAVVALDRDTPPTYWVGRDPLVRVLGRGEKPSEADYQALKRAVSRLLKEGAVAVDKPSGPGHAARYSLHLDDPTGITQ
jgi:hypothetical protein